MLQNLAASLILYEKITTTEAKARAVRPIVERLVTMGRTSTLATRRRLLAVLPVEGAVRKIIDVLGPRYRDRRGGYLRIGKIASRHGDGAKIASIEFIPS